MRSHEQRIQIFFLGPSSVSWDTRRPKTENIAPPSGEDITQNFSGLSDTGDVDMDIDDLPHPDTLFFWAQNNGDAGRRQLSVTPRHVNRTLDEGEGRLSDVTRSEDHPFLLQSTEQ
ncbi:hypothetical protein ETB97_009004 [Aspergillus alliaceus]|uniref:Uncharacterized protein n=1 Tax=Petromyces alliaceus TaxID=209559 RepID=A0A8H6E163_PETAA|nr:hypothetical protein ETB97_009004 [Aspergillus burnettii]